MDPTTVGAIIGLADKIGVIAMGIFLAVAIHKKILVPGWYVTRLEGLYDKCAGRSEARLDKFESREETRDAKGI